MLTLSYGYYQPETPDPSEGAPGIGWMESIEQNFSRLNDHDHDGINSAALSTTNLSKLVSHILAADWVNDGGGNFHVVVTVPAGISAAPAPLNDIIYYALKFMDERAGATYGDELGLTVERETATTFTVYSNQAIDVLVLYV